MLADSVFNPDTLDKRITLLSPDPNQDAAGGPGPNPVPSAPMWASIDTPYGQNLYQGSFVSQATHKVVIRYRPGVDATLKVQYGTRTFTILYVGNPKERNVALWLFCQEVT